ncbi:hypothetical protein RHODOSMS8_02178 [Rhodobiaceae bacterium]|nr:hypothetical protein RHODOSMS8_02178 [Rhodobiaceae bacterium]
MAKALNFVDTWHKALLTEVVYNRCLQKGPFVKGRSRVAVDWIKEELVTCVPAALKRTNAYGNAAARALAARYGDVLDASRSMSKKSASSTDHGNATGADMCIVRDKRSKRYVLCVDGTAISGGNEGEAGRDIEANIDNFFSPSMTPRGQLKSQIDKLEIFWEKFCDEEAARLSKPGARISPEKIAGQTDVTGHSLGGLVAIYLKRRRDGTGEPIGEVLAWSPPAEGGGITLIPGIGGLFSALLNGEGISVLTTRFDIAKLAGARPKGTVFDLGVGPRQAVDAHMIYWHTHLLEKGLDTLDAFLKKLDYSSSKTAKTREAAYLFRSSRPAEAVLRLPFGKTPSGGARFVYVSEHGGSLITGGPVMISHKHYLGFLETGKTGHVHPVLLKAALACGRHSNPEKIPDDQPNIGRRAGGKYALIYQQQNDFRVAFFKAFGRFPDRHELLRRQITLDARVGLNVL